MKIKVRHNSISKLNDNTIKPSIGNLYAQEIPNHKVAETTTAKLLAKNVSVQEVKGTKCLHHCQTTQQERNMKSK